MRNKPGTKFHVSYLYTGLALAFHKYILAACPHQEAKESLSPPGMQAS